LLTCGALTFVRCAMVSCLVPLASRSRRICRPKATRAGEFWGRRRRGGMAPASRVKPSGFGGRTSVACRFGLAGTW
jgi:hypothetical protein